MDKRSIIICSFLTLIFGTALHFVYEPLPFLWPVAPVNESVWEHLKLLFWPFLAASCIQVRWAKDRLTAWGGCLAAELLMPVDAAFRQYKSIFLSPKQTKMFLDGIRLDANRIKIPAEGDTVRVYGEGRFLALAHIERSIAELQIIKLFYTKESTNC